VSEASEAGPGVGDEGRVDTALAELLAATKPLADRFRDAGYRVYLVGGVVRDLLLGRPLAGDVDLTTDAPPLRTEQLLSGWADALWTQGQRFGTIGCRVGGTTYEITTHRAEVYVPESRKPAVVFSTDVAEDLARRDFTINAMAREVPSGRLVDPHGGEADLAAGRLRTPLDPHVTLSEDPLRMVRAARFAASHDLQPEPALLDAMTDMAGRLGIVAVERVRAELDRLLLTPVPSRGLALLGQTGLLAGVLPQHAGLSRERWTELLARVDRTPAELTARLVVLMDAVSDVAAGLRRLRSPNEQIVAAGAVRRALDVVVAAADRGSAVAPFEDGVVDDVTARRFAVAAGRHVEAARDSVTGELGTAAAAALGRALDSLDAAGELDALGPQLDGGEVMALLGMAPGPQVGAALEFLAELRIVEGRLPRLELERRLRAWWAETDRAAAGAGSDGEAGQPPTSW
jgi:poly(A) polymerase